MASAQTFYELFFGRFLGGIALGFGFVVFPLYVAEMCPSKVRGQFSAYTELFWSTGMVIAFTMNYVAGGAVESGWRLMVGGSVFPSIFLLISVCMIPESPYTLIAQGKTEEATSVLKRCSLSSQNLQDVMDRMQ